MKKTGNKLEQELSAFMENLDAEREKQQKARDAYLNDPASTERLAGARERMKVAELLYRARTDAKLSQKQIAEKMDVSQPPAARLER